MSKGSIGTNQSVYLDYVTITEIPSQVNTISCTSINENMVMLANSGVNTADMNAVTTYLNSYYNRTYTAAEYQAILNHCTDLPASYVLAAAGAEAGSVEASYQYSFNGKPIDEEGLGGGGSTYDYGFRIYNAQLGKFLSVDPLTKSYPELTPFQYSSNNPILNIDIDGKEGENYVFTWFENYGDAVFDLATAYNFSNVGALLILGHAISETGYGTQGNLKYTNNLWNFAPNELRGESSCSKGGRWACFTSVEAAFLVYVDRMTSQADLIEYENPNFNPSYPEFGELLVKNEIPTESAILSALRINGDYGYDPGNNKYGQKLLRNTYDLSGHYLKFLATKITTTKERIANLEKQQKELLEKKGLDIWTLEYRVSLSYISSQLDDLNNQLKSYENKEFKVKEVRSKLKTGLKL